MVTTVKLGTPYIRGNNEEIINKLSPTRIHEGLAVMRKTVSTVDQIVVADGTAPAYGIAGQWDGVCQSVVCKGMRVAVQLDTGVSPAALIGKPAYVAANGTITDATTTGCLIGVFADSESISGIDSYSLETTIANCAFIDVLPAPKLETSSTFMAAKSTASNTQPATSK